MMTEQHVHEFGPPKLATDGGGGSFRQCACGYYSSITFVDGWEQGRGPTRGWLRAEGFFGFARRVAGGRFVSVPVVTTAASRLSMGGSRVVPLRWLSCGRRAYWFTPTWRQGRVTAFLVTLWTGETRMALLRSIRAMLSV